MTSDFFESERHWWKTAQISWMESHEFRANLWSIRTNELKISLCMLREILSAKILCHSMGSSHGNEMHVRVILSAGLIGRKQCILHSPLLHDCSALIILFIDTDSENLIHSIRFNLQIASLLENLSSHTWFRPNPVLAFRPESSHCRKKFCHLRLRIACLLIHRPIQTQDARQNSKLLRSSEDIPISCRGISRHWSGKMAGNCIYYSRIHNPILIISIDTFQNCRLLLISISSYSCFVQVTIPNDMFSYEKSWWIWWSLFPRAGAIGLTNHFIETHLVHFLCLMFVFIGKLHYAARHPQEHVTGLITDLDYVQAKVCQMSRTIDIFSAISCSQRRKYTIPPCDRSLDRIF
jgi:hypothetical protein